MIHAQPQAARRDRLLPLAWMLLPLLVAGYQVSTTWIAHRSAGGQGWLLPILTSPLLGLLILCEIGSLILWMYVLARMPLSRAYPLSAISYVLVILASNILFHEPMSLPKLAGSIAIMTGVCLIGRSPAETGSAGA